MKKSLVGLSLKLALSALFLSAAAQADALKTTKVSGNIYMISGAGGNVAVSVGDDGILEVDSFVSQASKELKESLAKLGSKNGVRYLLNTHWHGDHTGGNAALGSNIPVIAHDNVRLRMMHDQENYFGKAPASPKAALPVLTFNDAMTLHFNDDTVQLKHYPNGHTDGDAMVYFTKANVLHTGDDYFKDMYPFVDMTTGGSVVGLANNVGKVIKELTPDVKIIPGHGALANLTEFKAYHKMLKASIAIVSKGVKEGLSLADIQKKGLGAELAVWGKGFIPEKDWITFTYQSITRKKGHAHDGADRHHH